MKNKPSNRPKNSKSMVVPITINGSNGSVDTSTIPQKDWKHCHGKTEAGVEVNSLQVTFCGDSAIIRRTDGFMTSYDANEFEVLASQYLAARKAANESLKS